MTVRARHELGKARGTGDPFPPVFASNWPWWHRTQRAHSFVSRGPWQVASAFLPCLPLLRYAQVASSLSARPATATSDSIRSHAACARLLPIATFASEISKTSCPSSPSALFLSRLTASNPELSADRSNPSPSRRATSSLRSLTRARPPASVASPARQLADSLRFAITQYRPPIRRPAPPRRDGTP